jgi:hypothetical protein
MHRRCKVCQRYLYRNEQLVCWSCRWRIKRYVDWASRVVRAAMSVDPRNSVRVG